MKLRFGDALVACTLSGVMFSGAAVADAVDISLGSDTGQVKYILPLSYSGYGRTDVEFGFLYTESDDVMLTTGLHVRGEAGSHAPGLSFGVGIKAFVVSVGDKDLAALTLGGEARFVLPSLSRLSSVAFFNYAPSIVSFGDAEKFSEFGLQVEYEVFPETAVYGGYRKITADIENGSDADLDKNGHVGIRLTF